MHVDERIVRYVALEVLHRDVHRVHRQHVLRHLPGRDIGERRCQIIDVVGEAGPPIRVTRVVALQVGAPAQLAVLADIDRPVGPGRIDPTPVALTVAPADRQDTGVAVDPARRHVLQRRTRVDHRFSAGGGLPVFDPRMPQHRLRDRGTRAYRVFERGIVQGMRTRRLGLLTEDDDPRRLAVDDAHPVGRHPSALGAQGVAPLDHLVPPLGELRHLLLQTSHRGVGPDHIDRGSLELVEHALPVGIGVILDASLLPHRLGQLPWIRAEFGQRHVQTLGQVFQHRAPRPAVLEDGRLLAGQPIQRRDNVIRERAVPVHVLAVQFVEPGVDPVDDLIEPVELLDRLDHPADGPFAHLPLRSGHRFVGDPAGAVEIAPYPHRLGARLVVQLEHPAVERVAGQVGHVESGGEVIPGRARSFAVARPLGPFIEQAIVFGLPGFPRARVLGIERRQFGVQPLDGRRRLGHPIRQPFQLFDPDHVVRQPLRPIDAVVVQLPQRVGESVARPQCRPVVGRVDAEELGQFVAPAERDLVVSDGDVARFDQFGAAFGVVRRAHGCRIGLRRALGSWCACRIRGTLGTRCATAVFGATGTGVVWSTRSLRPSATWLVGAGGRAPRLRRIAVRPRVLFDRGQPVEHGLVPVGVLREFRCQRLDPAADLGQLGRAQIMLTPVQRAVGAALEEVVGEPTAGFGVRALPIAERETVVDTADESIRGDQPVRHAAVRHADQHIQQAETNTARRLGQPGLLRAPRAGMQRAGPIAGHDLHVDHVVADPHDVRHVGADGPADQGRKHFRVGVPRIAERLADQLGAVVEGDQLDPLGHQQRALAEHLDLEPLARGGRGLDSCDRTGDRRRVRAGCARSISGATIRRTVRSVVARVAGRRRRRGLRRFLSATRAVGHRLGRLFRCGGFDLAGGRHVVRARSLARFVGSRNVIRLAGAWRCFANRPCWCANARPRRCATGLFGCTAASACRCGAGLLRCGAGLLRCGAAVRCRRATRLSRCTAARACGGATRLSRRATAGSGWGCLRVSSALRVRAARRHQVDDGHLSLVVDQHLPVDDLDTLLRQRLAKVGADHVLGVPERRGHEHPLRIARQYRDAVRTGERLSLGGEHVPCNHGRSLGAQVVRGPHRLVVLVERPRHRHGRPRAVGVVLLRRAQIVEVLHHLFARHVGTVLQFLGPRLGAVQHISGLLLQRVRVQPVRIRAERAQHRARLVEELPTGVGGRGDPVDQSLELRCPGSRVVRSGIADRRPLSGLSARGRTVATRITGLHSALGSMAMAGVAFFAGRRRLRRLLRSAVRARLGCLGDRPSRLGNGLTRCTSRLIGFPRRHVRLADRLLRLSNRLTHLARRRIRLADRLLCLSAGLFARLTRCRSFFRRRSARPVAGLRCLAGRRLLRGTTVARRVGFGAGCGQRGRVRRIVPVHLGAAVFAGDEAEDDGVVAVRSDEVGEVWV
ncbi:hypothetical protein NONI108955_40840 [Nocardia ninae]